MNSIEKYYIKVCENGDLIDWVDSFDEAEKTLQRFEEEDKADGIYTPGFYGIYDENGEKIG